MSRTSTHVMLIGFLITVALSSPLSAQTQPDTVRRRSAPSALHRGMELAAEGARTRRRQAIASRASMPRHNRRGSRIGRERSPRSTPFPFDQLSPEEKINAQIFRTSLRALASDVQYRTYEAPFNSDTFFWTDFTPRQGFATAAAYRSYLARLRDVPRYFDEQIANMRAGLARGYTRAARVGARTRSDDRAVRQRRRQQSVVRAVHADAGQHAARPIRTRSAPKPPPSFATSSRPPTRGC